MAQALRGSAEFYLPIVAYIIVLDSLADGGGGAELVLIRRSFLLQHNLILNELYLLLLSKMDFSLSMGEEGKGTKGDGGIHSTP